MNKKTRTQPIRKVNNRLHIYYNSEDKIFYNTPQENKRQLLKKQNMFGYVTDQKFNQPLQKGTTQYESVQIVQAEGETNAVYFDDGRQTWISPLKYPAFERQIIAETARRLKIDHRTDAHKAAKEKIKAICKDQAIQHAKMITVFKASEFISILKNHETFDTSKKVLVASRNYRLSRNPTQKQILVHRLIYFRGNPKDGKFWSGLNNRKRLMMVEVEKQREVLRKNNAPLIHLTRTRRYFKALQAHFQRDETLAKSDNDIATQCAILLDIEQHANEVLQDAFQHDYNLQNGYEVAGVSIATIGREVANGLKAACIVCKVQSKNQAIEYAHDAVRLRKVKKSATTNRKKASKWKINARLEQDFRNELLKYNVPSVVELTTMVEKTRLDIQFHQRTKGRMPFDEKQKSPIHFHHDMVSGSVYKELVALYSMQEYMDVNPTSVKSFIQFLVQTKEGERWVRFYFSALVVAKKHADEGGKRYKTPSLLANTLMPVYNMLLDVKKYLHGATKHRYTQLLTPLVFSHYFSMRKINNIEIHIKSQHDYNLFHVANNAPGRPAHPNGLPEFDYGLTIVVLHGNRFRIIKKEKKTRKDDTPHDNGDFNYVINGSETDDRQGLHAICCDMVDAYEYATGHRVTSDNTEPRMAITKGQYGAIGFTCTKIHLFPLILPTYKFGSPVFLSPVLPAGTAANAVIKCASHPEEFVPDDLKINNWKNTSYALRVSKMKAMFTINGKDIELPLKAMQCPVKAPNTLKLPNVKKANNPGVDTSMKVLDNIWKTMVATGNIVLPKKLFGEMAPIPYTGTITQHMQFAARPCVPKPVEPNAEVPKAIACTLDYDYAGRYGSAIVKMLIRDYLAYRDNCSDKNALANINRDINDILVAENHISEKVIKRSYDPFKCQLKDLASLFQYTDYVIERMSSHPASKPTWDKCYFSFVEYKLAHGEIENRFNNMTGLTILEQNAQLFWFKLVWELYRVICEYDIVSLKQQWDKHMKVAQTRWEEKFNHDASYHSQDNDSLCQRLFRVLGKRKATEDIHPRVNPHENVPV